MKLPVEVTGSCTTDGGNIVCVQDFLYFFR